MASAPPEPSDPDELPGELPDLPGEPEPPPSPDPVTAPGTFERR